MQAVLVQAIGYIGVVLFIISYQVRSNRKLFLFQMLGSMAFCFQFLLLSAYSGSLNLLIIIVRNIMLSKYNDLKWVRRKEWVFVLSGLSTIVLLLTWSGLMSLLPFAALVGTTIGYWANNAQKIRFANLVCGSPSWLLYDILIGSWGGITNELITLGSILLSIYRYGWKALGDENSEFQKSEKKG